MALIPGINVYIPPGAYSEGVSRPSTVSLPGGPKIVCIIGFGQREEVLIESAAGGETSAQLAAYPVLTGSETVYLNGVQLHKGSGSVPGEYFLNETTGELAFFALSTGDQLTIEYIATGDINDPELFYRFEDLKEKHGTPSLTNTLSLGAQMAFENGAPVILACQASTTDINFALSYTALEKEDCNIIVPLPTSNYDAVFGNGKIHVDNMSKITAKKERMLIIGAPLGTTVSDVLDNATGVDAYYGDSYRVVYCYPDEYMRDVDTLPGIFIAAVIAGKAASFTSVTTPLTWKDLSGFLIPNDKKMTETEMNLLAADGVTVITPTASGGRIRHGLTTTNSGDVNWEEPSVVWTKDYVAQVSRQILENTFTGKVIDADTTPGEVKAKQQSICLALVGTKTISRFANVSAVQSDIDPRQINVTFDIMPQYPLNWIYIKFSLGVI